MLKFIPNLLILLCFNFNCSEFNNPIKPTHISDFYYRDYGLEILVMTSRVGVQSSNGFIIPTDKETPIITLYLKTDTDFSDKFSILDEQNSTFIYRVYFDSTAINRIYYKTILSSVSGGTTDTSYHYHAEIKKCIDVTLNNGFMNNPEQFLWQAKVNNNAIYVLPPEPYAYIVKDVIINP